MAKLPAVQVVAPVSKKFPSIGRAALLRRRFLRNERGGLAVMAAVTLVPIVALAGGATDFARARASERQLQQAIDAAVLAGVKAPADRRDTQALEAFRSFDFRQITPPDPVFTPGAGGAYHGVARGQSPTAFLAIAGIGNLLVKAEATAALKAETHNVCMTLLWTATYSIMSGATVQAPSCTFDFRSTRPFLAASFSNSTVNTEDLCIRGTAVSNMGSLLPNLRTACTLSPAFSSPPAALTAGACQYSMADYLGRTSVSLTPGVYCGGLNFIGANITMAPGLYVFRGAFSVTGGSLSGSGVTLFQTDASVVNLNGLSRLDLSAAGADAAGGAIPGVLWMEPAGSYAFANFIITSRPANGSLRGLVYLPNRLLQVNGAGANTDELTLVLGNISLNNVSGWTLQPHATSEASAPGGDPYLKG